MELEGKALLYISKLDKTLKMWFPNIGAYISHPPWKATGLRLQAPIFANDPILSNPTPLPPSPFGLTTKQFFAKINKYMQNCIFSNPQIFNGGEPSSTDQEFQFAAMDCTSTDQEFIQSQTTSTSFYLNKTISYGDFLNQAFLLLFLIFGITCFLLSWFIPRKINWKSH